jgi:RNA polymerase sigma factor (TIGR02999 family)
MVLPWRGSVGDINDRPSAERISRWLDQVREGRRAAIDALAPLVYGELRRVAHAYMRRERPGHTLQATALVNEAFLRLLRARHVAWQNRAHFCAIAANAMREILIEHARRRQAAKRGPAAVRLSTDDFPPAAPEQSVDAVALDEALRRLHASDARRARIVELRYFAGLTIEEIAEVTRSSPATVKRDWVLARAWLRRQLHGHVESVR